MPSNDDQPDIAASAAHVGEITARYLGTQLEAITALRDIAAPYRLPGGTVADAVARIPGPAGVVARELLNALTPVLAATSGQAGTLAS